jgi:subtilisin family serine protease
MSSGDGAVPNPDEPGPGEPAGAASGIRRAIGACRRALGSWVAGLGPAGRFLAVLLLLGGIAGAVIIVTRGSQRGGPSAVRALPNEYVVTFGGGIGGETGRTNSTVEAGRIRASIADSEAAEAAAVAAGGKIQFRYRAVLIGFSATLPPAALKAVIRASGGRARIEPNWEARQTSAAIPAPSQGLDRIGQRLLPLDTLYTPPAAGSRKVHVYIIDGALRRTHAEFRLAGNNSRVGNGYNVVGPAPLARCYEHATAVAAIVGGKTYGVAPTVELHSVRVIDCDNRVTSAAVIAGVEWTATQFQYHNRRPAVANMSLEFDLSGLPELKEFISMDQAIRNAVNLGIRFVAAAGNDGMDACRVSPARIGSVMTVGSTDPETDEIADTSNFGQCVKLYAPGMAITSAAAGSDQDNDIHYGTSFAAPHVAGVAALVLSQPGVSPGAVWAAIFAAANRDSGKPGGTPAWCGVRPNFGPPDRLLHWGAGSTDGKLDSEDPPPSPLACQ